MEITLLTRFVGLFSFCIVMKGTSTFAADNAGREFVFAFPPNYEFQEPGNLRLLIHPTEQTTQTLMNVTITYRGTSYSLALDLRSPPYNVSLPSDLALTRISGLTNSTVVVQTDHDIILVAANFETRSMDTFVVLPTSYLGKEYFVATTPQRNSWAILISASSEPVTVEVAVKYHVTFLGKDYKSGDVIKTSLSPFQTMQLEPFVDTTSSVTRILANASVSVTVGCTCATIPSLEVGGCDFIAEHLAPFDRWGQSFVLGPFINRQSGYMFQVISGRNNTRVWIGGDVLILRMGEIYTQVVSQQKMTSITSNQPIMVLQYSMGTEYDQRPGDPALLMVPHMDQFKSFAEFPIIDFSSAAINDVYLSITTDCNATSEIRLNDSSISQISWLEEYSVETWNHRNICTVWMAVEGGGYVLRSRDSRDANSPVATFMSLVYGTGFRIGFIYTAGNFFDELTCSDTGDTLTGKGQEVVPCQRLQSPSITVQISPINQEVNRLERIQLTCAFNNALYFEWQKDGAPIQMTAMQRTYFIEVVSVADVGYYQCLGRGILNDTAATASAAVAITDVIHVAVSNLVFNYQVGRPQELSDPSSETYRNQSEIIRDFLVTNLVLADEFEDMSTFVVVSRLRPGSVVADVVIYVSSDGRSATELQQQISDALTVIARSSDGLLNISRATVSSPLICYPSTWSTEYGVVSFRQGELGSITSSTNICPYYTSNAGQPIATAMCSGDRISQAQWEPSENCGEITRPLSRVLEDVQSGGISEETADEASSLVANATEDTIMITARDINTIANITTVIANFNIGNPKVTENFVTIVSNVAAVENSQLERAEEESNAISDIVIAFEQQLMNTDVEDGEALDVAEENVVVQVTSVPPDRLQGGVVLTVQGEGVSDLSQSEISFNATGGISGSEDVIAQSVIPPDIVGTVTPVPAGTNQTNSSSENVRVIMSLYSTPSLFISQSVIRFNRESMLVNRSANTPVISLSIGESKLENLAEPITLTFVALEGGSTNQTCVSWDFLTSDWSTDGCILVNVTEEFKPLSAPATNGEEYYACSCNHLTNFAILMDIRQRESPRAFGILSYIGCAVSIVCLVLTLATYLWNKKLRNRQSHRIFICLCFTLLGFYVTYVVMISLDSGLSEANPIPCSVLAALVQFFMLSSIAWMGVEGYNTYLIVVRVFNTYVPYYLLKASLVAWGIPAAVVGVTGGIARNDYVRDNLCFPDLWSQVGGLLIPVAAILLINVIIFILAIRQLALSAKVGGKVKKDKQAERRETIERVQNAITILVLLGLTWIIGYLLLLDVFVDVIQTLFIVFNSFQGLFIFLLYCVRKPVVRQQWGLTCATRGGTTDDGSSSGMRRRSNPTPAPTSSMSPATDTREDSQEFRS